MSPERFSALYSAARDWAEKEAEACGDCRLPSWTPSCSGAARACGAQNAEETDLVIRVASESWIHLQRHWAESTRGEE